jgi:hypothetical protein
MKELKEIRREIKIEEELGVQRDNIKENTLKNMINNLI